MAQSVSQILSRVVIYLGLSIIASGLHQIENKFIKAKIVSCSWEDCLANLRWPTQ